MISHTGFLVGPALSRGPIIIADIITIVITWKTQYQTYNIGRKVSAPSTIATVFLRDGKHAIPTTQRRLICLTGTIYFV